MAHCIFQGFLEIFSFRRMLPFELDGRLHPIPDALSF